MIISLQEALECGVSSMIIRNVALYHKQKGREERGSVSEWHYEKAASLRRLAKALKEKGV